MKTYAIFISIIISILLLGGCNSNEHHCDKSYVDVIFKNQRFYDSINPYPIIVSYSEKCTQINGKYYKKLFVTDSMLGNNDTLFYAFVRDEKKTIYVLDTMGKAFAEKEYSLFSPKLANLFSGEKHFLNLVDILVKNNDSIFKYESGTYLRHCKYFLEISKKEGLINAFRDCEEGNFID